MRSDGESVPGIFFPFDFPDNVNVCYDPAEAANSYEGSDESENDYYKQLYEEEQAKNEAYISQIATKDETITSLQDAIQQSASGSADCSACEANYN